MWPGPGEPTGAGDGDAATTPVGASSSCAPSRCGAWKVRVGSDAMMAGARSRHRSCRTSPSRSPSASSCSYLKPSKGVVSAAAPQQHSMRVGRTSFRASLQTRPCRHRPRCARIPPAPRPLPAAPVLPVHAGPRHERVPWQTLGVKHVPCETGRRTGEHVRNKRCDRTQTHQGRGLQH